jgi:prepilin-type N-terminal cleavage/methylation domain-containing protein
MGKRGFTLIEVVIVIVILSIVSAITIYFLVSSLRVYTMTVNQKTLFDEGKLALERMSRDIRDARSIIGRQLLPITFTETMRQPKTVQVKHQIRSYGNTLRKVKNAGCTENTFAMADNVSTFTVTNATNEIQLQLTLSLASGENVTLQTKVYPKNLQEDLTSTYKNFRILDSSGNPIVPTWEEVRSP